MTRTDSASRVIRASPQALYRAFVDPEALLAWLPPGGMTAELHRFDPRPGGGYRMSLTYEEARGAGKTSANTDVVEATFVELVPDERVVQEVEFESDDPAFAGRMRMTWSLVAAPGGTAVTIRCQNVPPGIDEEDHDAGLRSTLENLAAYAEGLEPDAAAHSPPALGQINIVVRDLPKAVAFYRLLGVTIEEIPIPAWRPHHASGVTANGVQVELDSVAFAKQWNPGLDEARLGSATLPFFHVASRDEVDRVHARVIAAGYRSQKAPEDAFWGARYAIVEDPDGNAVGIMSAIDEAMRRPPPPPPA